MRHVFGMRADAPQNSKNSLHKQWRLDQAASDEVMQVVEMARVVAFKFEARSIFAQCPDDEFNLFVGVAKDNVPRAFQSPHLPLVLELPVSRQHRKKSEIHRSHI